MKKIGLFYGHVESRTEKIAERIWKLIGEDKCDILKVRDSNKNDLERYQNIIFGASTLGKATWDGIHIKSGWFSFINELDKADLKGRKIAMFGLGDHIRYPDHFVDALGDIYEKLSAQGVDTIGKVDPSGYQFNDSKALVDGMFVGLPIDEEFESERTDERIEKWIKDILQHFD